SPSAIPALIIDEHAVLAPRKPVHAPSPGRKRGADGNAKAEADGPSNKKSRTRRSKYDQRIIIRHHNESRIGGQNLDVRPAVDDDLRIGSKIPVIIGPAAL